MPRYFLEISYKGTNYNGFQVQHNAHTVQAEIEKAVKVLLSSDVSMTGSSRTDAGVHALQNFFHFDIPSPVATYRGITKEQQFVYKLNAIVPRDIAIRGLYRVKDDAHCRFDAVQREYNYYLYDQKNPFLDDRAYYYPYKPDVERMNEAATLLKEYKDFTSFSKRNTQVRTFICNIEVSQWIREGEFLIYNVAGNRFLRGMVRALTATMLKLGRGSITMVEFRRIIESRDCTKASFAVPAHGLFLKSVKYPDGYFS